MQLAVIFIQTFHLQADLEELVRLYRLALDQPARNTQASYNVCPTDPVETIVEREGKRELVTMRWGLVPRWGPKPLKELRAATFNARVETVETKPFFRDAFKRTRCLLPISGYNEWQGYAGRQATLVFHGSSVSKRVNSSKAPAEDPTLIDRV